MRVGRLLAWMVRLYLPLMAAGCLGAQVASVLALRKPTALDSALTLAALLPVDADGCVVAEPALLPAPLAELYAPIAQGERFVWQAGPLIAYAQATWQRAGRKRWVAIVKFSGDAAGLRVWLAQRSGLDLRWEDADAISCDAEHCPTLAHFLANDTLRLARGAVSSDAPGAQGAQTLGVCAQLLRAHPQAFEVSYRRGESLFVDAASDVPVATNSWTQPASSGVVVQREELMSDEAAAQRDLERDACRELWGGGSTALDAVCERSRDALAVHTTASLRWDDLRLRLDDGARHARAQQYGEALARVRPDGAVDLANLADVWKELTVRRALLDTSGADPRPQVLALSRFAQRALAQHPAEAKLREFAADLERLAHVTPASEPAMTAP